MTFGVRGGSAGLFKYHHVGISNTKCAYVGSLDQRNAPTQMGSDSG